jgi:ABC-type glycerol-3-phosphate transport system substrate-binding protein
MYNLLEGIDKENYKKVIPLELPGFKHNQTYAGDHSFPWAVPKNAKNREEAVRFLLYWCQPSIADEWVRNTKSPTGIKGSMVQTGFGVDVYENFDYTINNKYKGKKLPVNLHNNGRFFGIKNKDIPNYFVEVITGSVTSREAMRLIRSRLVRS